MTEQLSKLEEAAVLYIAAKNEKEHAEIKMEQRKAIIERLMEEAGENEIQVPYNDHEAIKIKRTLRSSKKFNKEQLAEDMDVSEDVIKQDFLVKAVQDQRLTYDKYRNYFYHESKENVSIRVVKAMEEK